MNINYQSDFKLNELSSLSDTTTPFRFTYKTASLSSYVAQFDGENYTACRHLDDGSLLVIFDDHNLSAGAMQVRREYFLTDEDFANGICHRVTVERLDVVLVAGESDDDSATVEVYPTYQKGADGYTPIKGVDYFTQEEIDDLVDDLILDTTGDDTRRVMSQAASTEAFIGRYELATEDIYAYGIQYDTSISSPACTRIGSSAMHRTLPIQSMMRGCLLSDDGEVVEYLPADDWRSSTRDGSAGQVMVEIPAHYRRFVTDGTLRQVWISEYSIEGYTLVPLSYVSAYEASRQIASASVLASVVNDTAEYRGGDNVSSYDNTYRTLLGRPTTGYTLTSFRTMARRRNGNATTEWNCMTYEMHKTLFWLFAVEYATLDSQAAINSETTTEGYKQGGLGDGVTTLNATNWNVFNGFRPFVPCGHTDSLGNGTGEVLYEVYDEAYLTDRSAYANRYRGVENLFGHIWKWVDGILVDSRNTSDNATTVAYMAADPASYASFTSLSDSGYEGYEQRGSVARNTAYITAVIFGEFGDILASTVGGSNSTYFCDNHYMSATASSVRAVRFGGNASAGLGAGLTYVDLTYTASDSNANLGTRLCFIPNN